MALSRIRTTQVLDAIFPFTKYTGTSVSTLVLVSGRFPFYKYDGTYDTINLT